MTNIKPQLVKIVPWEEIEERYRELIAHHWRIEPMLQLVEYIQASGMDKRLFAYMSVDRLIVTIYNPAEWNNEALRIQFKQRDQQWRFEYLPKSFEQVEMERFCAENEGIDKFLQFIDWLKW